MTQTGSQVVLIAGDGSDPALVDELIDALRAAGVDIVLASPTPHDDATAAFVEGRTFDLLLDADLLMEASGDPATRYLANDAAAVRGIPMVWVDAATGEVGVAFDERGVDYRDRRAPGTPTPAAPAPGTPAPGTPAPGAAGTSAAPAPPEALAETAARLASAVLADPDTAGTALVWDGSGFRPERFARDADAARPGSLEERTELREPDAASSITAPQLAKLLAGSTTLGVHESVPVLLDVRDDHEVAFVTLPDAVHIPLAQLPARLDGLAADPGRDAPIVVYCHHGVRSSRALGMLQLAGFTRVRHLTGGIDAWSVQVDPTLPRY